MSALAAIYIIADSTLICPLCVDSCRSLDSRQRQLSVLTSRWAGTWRMALPGREHANNMIPETGLRIIGDVGQRLQCGTVTVLVQPAKTSRSVLVTMTSGPRPSLAV